MGYILAHVTANLLIFAGPSAIDAYAAKLRTLPIFLWGVRVLLLVSVVLHVLAATHSPSARAPRAPRHLIGSSRRRRARRHGRCAGAV